MCITAAAGLELVQRKKLKMPGEEEAFRVDARAETSSVTHTTSRE